MAEKFSDTTDWGGAARAFAIWAAHFSALWTASSVVPGSAAARWIALAATFGACGALAWLWRKRRTSGHDPILTASIALSAFAILFGATPALIG